MAVAASDSSDRLDKTDQKVSDTLYFCHLIIGIRKSCFDYVLLSIMQTQRRLAQNREAARKSRLRKKVCLMYFKTLFWILLLSLFCQMLSNLDSLSGSVHFFICHFTCLIFFKNQHKFSNNCFICRESHWILSKEKSFYSLYELITEKLHRHRIVYVNLGSWRKFMLLVIRSIFSYNKEKTEKGLINDYYADLI